MTGLLPVILSGALPTDEFNSLALILQASAYVTFFDLGFQTAVAQMVALNPVKSATVAIANGLLLLLASATVAIAGCALVAVYLGALFPQIPSKLLRPTVNSLLLLTIPLSLTLPGNALVGYFTGVHRIQVPAAIVAAASPTS